MPKLDARRGSPRRDEYSLKIETLQENARTESEKKRTYSISGTFCWGKNGVDKRVQRLDHIVIVVCFHKTLVCWLSWSTGWFFVMVWIVF